MEFGSKVRVDRTSASRLEGHVGVVTHVDPVSGRCTVVFEEFPNQVFTFDSSAVSPVPQQKRGKRPNLPSPVPASSYHDVGPCKECIKDARRGRASLQRVTDMPKRAKKKAEREKVLCHLCGAYLPVDTYRWHQQKCIDQWTAASSWHPHSCSPRRRGCGHLHTAPPRLPSPERAGGVERYNEISAAVGQIMNWGCSRCHLTFRSRETFVKHTAGCWRLQGGRPPVASTV
eukprot:Sspe_Gene.119728::Locus_116481_Transcript_1_1_Confidence_1.000_Length_744::g.119728::m.119728